MNNLIVLNDLQPEQIAYSEAFRVVCGNMVIRMANQMISFTVPLLVRGKLDYLIIC